MRRTATPERVKWQNLWKLVRRLQLLLLGIADGRFFMDERLKRCATGCI
jgi:hypothetical protein